ncbi:MAG: PEGA domain-containing protein [Acutalibacteraceae bacterium]|nr:PEGA domain-containing protein [Acutalibacteraceae bacterium]
MKKKAFIIVAVLVLICTVSAAFLFSGNKPDAPPTEETSNSTSVSQTDPSTELNESQISEILKNTAVITVYAPDGAKVLLDGKEMPYSATAGCYRIIDELKGKHILTVTRDGYESFLKELDLDKEKNYEIRVELTALQSIKVDALKQAEKILPEIIAICDDGSGDLSDFSFYNEEEKNTIQDTVYGIIDELSVDTENYKTGKIKLLNISFDETFSYGDTISVENVTNGRMIKFTADYSYTWEFKSDAYEDSGVDSATANGLILLDYINGQWCIRELYLPLRKNIH